MICTRSRFDLGQSIYAPTSMQLLHTP